MNVKIWHNPRCSKSRQTLQLLQDRGIEPTIVDYQKCPPDIGEINRILKLLDDSAGSIVRRSEKLFQKLRLENATDAELIAAMAKHPILIERPIVEANGKAAVGRPPENILKILK